MALGFDSTTDDVLAGHDLTGRHYVVTGASGGLGEETARALAAHGAAVTLGVRDPGRGAEAMERIRAGVPGAVLRTVHLDLGSLADVRRFAAEVQAEAETVGQPISALINNAGVMACPFGLTVDGFEIQFGTNHLGHFLLGVLLAPALERSGGRLVSLSSRGHSFADVSLDDWNFERMPYDPFVAYGRSKTANALFAVGFQQRFGDRGVVAVSVHPGGIRTRLGRHMTAETLADLGRRLATTPDQPFRWKSMAQGAATSVWAATASEVAGLGGAYLENCGPAERSDDEDRNDGVRPYAVDAARAEALWSLSERLVGIA